MKGREKERKKRKEKEGEKRGGLPAWRGPARAARRQRPASDRPERGDAKREVVVVEVDGGDEVVVEGTMVVAVLAGFGWW